MIYNVLTLIFKEHYQNKDIILGTIEDPSPMTTRRVLVNMMYLNDVDDGGETEFLYQSKRVQPKRVELSFG